MEAELGVPPPKDQAAQAESGAESSAPLPASAQDEPARTNPDANGSTVALATPANSIMDVRGVRYLNPGQQFPYEAPKGFVLVRGPNGEVDFSTKGYVRYLNQLGLNRFYTDAFGRTTELDLRQDIQLNRLQFILHGWLFDERFRYFWYAWTQNVSQGDAAQVVVGELRAACRRLVGKLPPALKSDPDAIKLAAACDDRSWTIIRLINTRLSRSGLVKDYEFSRATIKKLGQLVLKTCAVPLPAGTKSGRDRPWGSRLPPTEALPPPGPVTQKKDKSEPIRS